MEKVQATEDLNQRKLVATNATAKLSLAHKAIKSKDQEIKKLRAALANIEPFANTQKVKLALIVAQRAQDKVKGDLEKQSARHTHFIALEQERGGTNEKKIHAEGQKQENRITERAAQKKTVVKDRAEAAKEKDEAEKKEKRERIAQRARDGRRKKTSLGHFPGASEELDNVSAAYWVCGC
jgi:hypothetical protein